MVVQVEVDLAGEDLGEVAVLVAVGLGEGNSYFSLITRPVFTKNPNIAVGW